MTLEHEKLDLETMDVAAERRAELFRLFPEVQTERGSIDLDRLKLALGETVDAGRERYGLIWPGKADCFKTIQAPSIATLLPQAQESVGFDTTENLILEGDNLEILKLLQKAYVGKVDLIYIDPPYNTGSDLIYPDNYREELRTYLEYTGQTDDTGIKFGTNSETDGRFHSKWLNMMYPRLYLARNLLSERGIVAISIDYREHENLRRICNEIFGEENHKGTIVRTTGQTTGQDGGGLGSSFDYVILYALDAELELSGLPLDDSDLERYQEEDERGKYALWQLRKTGSKDRRTDRPNMYFPVEAPDGTQVLPVGPTGYDSRWRFDPKGYKRLKEDNYVVWKRRSGNGQDGGWWPYVKTYLEGRTKRPSPLWDDLEGSKKASIDLRALFGGNVFDNSKPVGLVERLLQICPEPNKDGLVLDFFAGSGTTAHAVLDLNNEDGGNRRFILVQLPEPTRSQTKDGLWIETEAWKAGYKTIAEVTKERVRRVIGRLDAESDAKLKLSVGRESDHGFRVFKLAESNFRSWDPAALVDTDSLATQLEMHVGHVRDMRTEADLLYEILLKSGFPLTTPIETTILAGKTVFSVGNGVFLICLERTLTLEAIRAMADMKPSRVVCLDEGFRGDDQLKTNAVQTFKTKGVVKFQTV